MSDTELLPKSKADGVQSWRFFTGACRRRSWTAPATIEITIGIATVRFPPWIDAAILAAVLRAVRMAI